MQNKVVLSTPITHSDWVSHSRQGIGQGQKSVQYMLDRCKQVGLQKIYWRCFDGGLANYASQLMDGVSKGFDADCYHAWNPDWDWPDLQYMKDYAPNFDSLKEAVAYGHQIGLEIHAWVTINEDDHGWGIISRFSRAHPQFRWIKRGGLPYNSQLSFAFPEVRKYKLELIKEILRYDTDGVFFDWMRTGDVRNEPQATPCGTADFGYEKPLVQSFQAKFGVDPHAIPNDDERWVTLRAEPQTLFMREARQLIKGKSERLRISMMGHHPWSYRGATPWINGNFNGLLLDVKTWAKEGLIDEAVAAGYFTPHVEGGTPAKAYAYMQEEVGGKCDVWLYWWLPSNAAEFGESIKAGEELNAKQILYWEGDYLDYKDRAADAGELQKVMDKYAEKGEVH